MRAHARLRSAARCQDYDPQAALYPEQHRRDAAIDLEMVVNPHRPDERPTLTPASRKLLAQFRWHPAACASHAPSLLAFRAMLRDPHSTQRWWQ